MAEIAITYEARTTVPLDTVTQFQGDAKKITQDNLDKLKRSILKHGFFVPMFVWKKSASSKTYIIDGHQRLKALLALREEGHAVPDIPVEYITAKSKKDAAEKLLAVSSQFGEFDIHNLEEWAKQLVIELPTLDIRLVQQEITLTGSVLDIDEFFVDEDTDRTKSDPVITCPECGHEFIL